jgi:hypothetical protein
VRFVAQVVMQVVTHVVMQVVTQVVTHVVTQVVTHVWPMHSHEQLLQEPHRLPQEQTVQLELISGRLAPLSTARSSRSPMNSNVGASRVGSAATAATGCIS